MEMGGGGGVFTLGKSLYMKQSGCKGDHCSGLKEPGSNGLAQVPGKGEIILCEHGNRRVVRMETNGSRTLLATHYQGLPLNSPNDLAFSPRGDVFFTDPPYGLNRLEDDPDFVLGFSGVFRIRREVFEAIRQGMSEVPEPELVERGMVRPNGIAFSQDGERMYVANSYRNDAHWRVYDVTADGNVTDGRLFLDATPLQKVGLGNPDGLKVDNRGNLFATGPGGVLIISPSGQHLGTVLTGNLEAANTVIGGDGFLYITATSQVMRVPVLSKAAAPAKAGDGA
ncbi:unnamed protein product [Discosporangium mesarthrocarpum]